MPSRASKDRDFLTNARRVVEQAIGEQMDGKPLADPDAGKNPAALALSKLGASKGGKARAAKLRQSEKQSHNRLLRQDGAARFPLRRLLVEPSGSLFPL
jgi:hypothetical protein